ncbi:unnamed protein product [Brachionus calyciflorus]|uniref:Uncharacterized protein n=1 Tax=Brachionus calyciflorus TaxID=104777 RepID=A0A814LWX3_9BILA|nr:unnamed protein product [Brachionus calyciflorus]
MDQQELFFIDQNITLLSENLLLNNHEIFFEQNHNNKITETVENDIPKRIENIEKKIVSIENEVKESKSILKEILQELRNSKKRNRSKSETESEDESSVSKKKRKPQTKWTEDENQKLVEYASKYVNKDTKRIDWCKILSLHGSDFQEGHRQNNLLNDHFRTLKNSKQF